MISKKAKYAIIALIYLAKAEENTPVLIGEIAESQHIPKKFLETILVDLKNAGYVSSKRGRYGGYYLLKQPEAINLAEIMRLFDGAIAFIPCVTHKYYEPCDECTNEEACGIRDVFTEIRNVTVGLLKKANLKEVMLREYLLNI